MARKKKALNAERRLRASEKARVGQVRDLNALAMALRGGDGNHGDARKAQSRKACRGKVSY